MRELTEAVVPGPPRGVVPGAGIGLLDLLVALAILGVLLPAAAVGWVRWRQRMGLRSAVAAVAAAARATRAAALAQGTARSLDFDRHARGLRWSVYTDGDGDGITREDILSGVDPRVSEPGLQGERSADLRLGLPSAVSAPGRSGPVRTGLRLGSSGLLTFSPSGTATSGSIWLSNAAGDAAGIRVYGVTGRISVWSAPAGAGWRRIQ